MKKISVIMLTIFIVLLCAALVIVFAFSAKRTEVEDSSFKTTEGELSPALPIETTEGGLLSVLPIETEAPPPASLAESHFDSTVSEEDIVYLTDYWKAYLEEHDAKEIRLDTIYAESVKLVKSGKTILFQRDFFTDRFARWQYQDDYRSVIWQESLKTPYDGVLFVQNREEDQVEREAYFIFIASLTHCFPQNIYYDDYDYFQYSMVLNRSYHPSFWVSFTYRELGYESVEEYYNALLLSKEGSYGNLTLVNFQGPYIHIYPDDVTSALINRYSSLRDTYLGQ